MSRATRTAALEALGRPITPTMIQGTMALFAAQALRPSPQFCSVHRDIAYGDAERHRLDVFRPLTPVPAATAQEPRPMVVFVHGGGFIGGDKGAADAPFYNNIGAWASRSGYVGVTMTYRLAPSAPWPAGAEDVAAAIAWLRAHGSAYGGDPSSLFVMGQSAGAVHVAGYLADTRYAAAESLAGAVLFSGLYDLARLTRSPLEDAYFGTDAARFAAQSTLAGLLTTPVPCLYSVAEFDPDSFQQQAGYLVAAHLAAKGVLPRMLYFAGHNHLSPALEIGDAEDGVGGHLADFIARYRR